jgi:hypothetical protein
VNDAMENKSLNGTRRLAQDKLVTKAQFLLQKAGLQKKNGDYID